MSAPSFSSFPPSFSSFPDLDAAPSNNTSNAAESSTSVKADKEKRKKNKRGEKRSEETRNSRKHEKTHKKEHQASKVERDAMREQAAVSTNSGPTGSKSENIFFFTDRKGDLMNLQYGGIHSGDIPKHYLVAGGRNILGLPKALVALRRVGKGVEIAPSHYRKASSLTDSSSRAALLQPPSRRIIPITDTSKYVEEDGFIRLPSRHSRIVPEVESYRSITRGEDDHSDSSILSDTEDSASSEDDNNRSILTAHQESLKLLGEELVQHPDSIDTWASLLRQTLSTIPITSKNATKARCEITVSILSRALSATPENARSKELRIPYLKAGEEIWHGSKLRSEWEDALKVGGIEFYMEWLEWKIRKGHNGVEGVIESARRALNSIGDDENAEVAKIRIFWRVATAMRTAGFCERAMAMFQAQAEMLFNTPSKIAKMSFQARLTDLEDFWESEVPRIGEEGASGWAAWYTSKDSHRRTSFRQPFQTLTIPNLDPYRQWANQELASDRTVRFPLRSDAEAVDPYCTVLFSDIQPMILDVKSRVAKHALRMAWLSFSGLHAPGLSLANSQALDWDDRWNLGYLTTPSYLTSIFPSAGSERSLLTDTVAGVVIGREREYRTPFGPIRCWGSDSSGPLDYASSDLSKPFRNGIWSAGDIQGVDENTLRRLFTVLKLDGDDIEWNSLALAVEVAISPKSAIRVSKSLLSVHQDSLSLWNAHAQLERMRGRLNEARKIYQTVLISNASKQPRKQTSLMWWNWAEMEWLAGEDQAALNVVLKSVSLQGSYSGVTILRAKRLLDDNSRSTASHYGWKEREGWTKLRALLELLTGDGPTDALRVFDEHLPEAHDSLAKESLTTASLVMLYYYGTTLKRPMPPALLRERAHSAFEAYPSNSIILGTLLEAERGQGIWGRIRTLLGGNDGKAKDVARRVEEVWVAGWEKGRWTSELERTRSGLAASIEHERTRASPVIWLIYIEFEIRVQELQRAKKLLFRAIAECPLVKDFYLVAFGPLRSVFQVHELNGLADTMAERGIRLHQSLDEIVHGIDVGDDGGKEGSEISDDEIEHNARELRRLMPY